MMDRATMNVWTSVCNGCHELKEVVEFETDHLTVNICRDCLKRALSVLDGTIEPDRTATN